MLFQAFCYFVATGLLLQLQAKVILNNYSFPFFNAIGQDPVHISLVHLQSKSFSFLVLPCDLAIVPLRVTAAVKVENEHYKLKKEKIKMEKINEKKPCDLAIVPLRVTAAVKAAN